MARGRKSEGDSKSEVIHVRLDKELLKSVDNFCKECKITRSEAVRLILEKVLTAKE